MGLGQVNSHLTYSSKADVPRPAKTEMPAPAKLDIPLLVQVYMVDTVMTDDSIAMESIWLSVRRDEPT
jgi:hypothetical protein